MRNCISVFALLVACAIGCAPVRAELLPPKADGFESAILKQKRTIDVYLPKETAKDASQKYETIYVLDGDWNAKIVTETVDFLQAVGFMPPVIVVSVPNFFDDKGVNSRDHDLTPTAQPNEKNSGGAAQFLSFLKTELIPYVNKTYPSNGINLGHGHSYGGLFLNYAIANDPTVFDGYLILDPAMWWQDKIVVKQLDEKLSSMPAKGKAVYIAGRSGSAFKGMGVDSLQPVYANKAPAGLHWQLIAYPNETHDSLKFKGTYDALRFMFRGYGGDSVNVIPDKGIVIPGLPLTFDANTDRFDIHYTTDGTEPTATSPKMDHRLTPADPTKVRFKSISSRGEFDREIPIALKRGTMLAPTRATKPDEKVEVRYSYFEPSAYPTFHGKPFDSGTAESPDLKKIRREKFAAMIERDHPVPADGYYAFVLRSSGPARISIAGKTIIDAPHSTDHKYQGFVVPMKAGTYTVRYTFLHDAKDFDIDVHLFQFKDDAIGWEHEIK
ncbi:MAG: alpha/beta hydrolase-fold protein [Rudaea sp.]